MELFTGQIVVITGASSGMGRAIALGLADLEQGFALLGVDWINLKKSQSLHDPLRDTLRASRLI